MSITDYFYHGSTRKLIVCFGTLFNNLEVHRKEDTNVTVPLTYASKEKFYITLKQDYDLNKMSNMQLPRMGFIITDIAYDFERKQSSIGKFHYYGADDTTHKRMFLPVPYDLQVELSIYSRNMDDGLQILEQIIPMFKPSFNITINELDPMGVMRDIPIILDGISMDDTSESDLEDGFRVLRWDLQFTIKANFYGPIQEQKVIKKVYVDYRTSADGEYVEDVDERYYVEVDPLDADQEDNWEYSEELISSHDSTNTVIMPVEIDMRARETDGLIFLVDSCSWEIV